ncbi:MAG: DUF975 domain-containing protein [Spirulina sp.]
MSPNLPKQDAIAPLSVGNVVTVAFVVYRSHLRAYSGIALRAILWIILPLLFFIPAFVSLAFDTVNSAAIGLSTLLGLVALIYGMAKYLANSAMISRLTFYELANRPETAKMARPQVMSRLWRFFWTAIILLVLAIGLYILFAIIFVVASLLVSVVTTIIAASAGNSPIVAGIIAVLLALIGMFGLLIGFLWFYARLFMLADLPLATAIEELSPTDTIGQSWYLTKNNAWRIVAISTIAFLITLPIIAIVQILSLIVQPLILATPPTSSSPALIAIAYLFLYGLSLASNLILIPFWQTLKGVLYYDLKSRREGLDLQLNQ